MNLQDLTNLNFSNIPDVGTGLMVGGGILLFIAVAIIVIILASQIFGAVCWARSDTIFLILFFAVPLILIIVGGSISISPSKENNLKAEKAWETIDENLKENYDIVEFSPILTDNNGRVINLKRWVQTAIEGGISNPMKINALTDKGNLITWEITIMPEENKILLMNKENESVSPAEYLIE